MMIKRNLVILFMVMFVCLIGFSDVVMAAEQEKPQPFIDPMGITDVGGIKEETSRVFHNIINIIIGITLSATFVSGLLLALMLSFPFGQRWKDFLKSWGFGIILALLILTTLEVAIKFIYAGMTS